MDFVILDLEWNTPFGKKKGKLINEIIEFGAVKLNDKLEQTDEFSMLVTPQLCKELSPFIEQLTHITMKELNEAHNSFPHALSEFAKFAKGCVLMSWSDADIHTLVENRKCFTPNFSMYFSRYYCDLQKYCEAVSGEGTSSKQMALSACCDLLGIKYDKNLCHRALEDARLAAECFKKLYDAERIGDFLQKTDKEFYKRLNFRTHYVIGKRNHRNHVGKLNFACPSCGTSLKPNGPWQLKGHSFRAPFFCNICRKKLMGSVTYKAKYDGIDVSHHLAEQQKQSAEDKSDTLSEGCSNMKNDKIIIRGAKKHNLKNIDVEIPRDKLTVVTGLSGSGKSSLAFDTLYAEGQRRYVESLSSYARQFLGQMEKPEVESIAGLSPAISIDQKTTSKNPRSTVGTATEIYDYLRLLYARIGIPHCPVCGKEIKRQTVDQIVDRVIAIGDGTKIQVLAPVIRGKKGEHIKELDKARKSGFVRVRVDDIIYDLSEEIRLEKNKKHHIDIIVDRLVIKPEIRSRLADSIEIASKLTDGLIAVNIIDGEDMLFSQNFACPDHQISIDELTPRMFSFNNPYGACDKCTGLGVFLKVDPDLVIPNYELSINQGGIKASGWAMEGNTIAAMYFKALSEKYGFSLDTPLKDLSPEIIDILLYGTGGELLQLERVGKYFRRDYEQAFEGIINNLERRFRETSSSWIREEIQGFMSPIPCEKCGGKRLSPISLAVTVGGISIAQFCDMSIVDAIEFLKTLELTEQEMLIGKEILKEIRDRLGFLNSVGLGYLTLSRGAGTLSGGESQRIRLATQIGSSLMGVMYILDEPSIGLHQRDNSKLLETLKRLRDIGNTVVVVEHDEETMENADYIVDIGPGAGVHGGEVVCCGTADDIKKCENSITGQYLSGKRSIAVPQNRREGNGKFLEIKGAAQNNLKNIDVKIPLGKFICITGVSGSGKSSLINEILYKKLAAELNRAKTHSGKHKAIKGIENLDKVIEINQSPIGRTPRSNPATYTGVFTDIRELYASTNDAKMRGYSAGRFSFNVKGGRCDACEGDGIKKIEMHFLPDIYVPCEVCKGKRYNRETLEVKYKGKSIYDILEMTVEEGVEFFANHPRILRKLTVLNDVGLGYIKIGQPATTLSGGEAQRIKLAAELSRRSTGKTVYILDEPTTGLHVADVHRLVNILQTLADGGNTVIVIEHNLDLIKTADYIIDLGPEGGNGGGEIVAQGTPEEVAACENSYTGMYLKKLLGKK